MRSPSLRSVTDPSSPKGMPPLPVEQDAHAGWGCANRPFVRPATGRCCRWSWFPPSLRPEPGLSEQGQVLLDLPIAHPVVEVFELALLHVDEVVAVRRVSEGLAEDLVTLEVPGGVEQGAREDLDAALLALVGRHLIHVRLV